MIGILLGLFLAVQFFLVAWNGALNFAFLLPVVVLTVIGAVLAPRTVGLIFTTILFAGIPAILVALFRGGWAQAGIALILCICVWVGALIVGAVRPEST